MMSLIRDLHGASKTLLAHFHFICRGQMPFNMDWTQANRPKSLQKMARISDDEAEFLQQTSEIVQPKSKPIDE